MHKDKNSLHILFIRKQFVKNININNIWYISSQYILKYSHGFKYIRLRVFIYLLYLK